MVKLYDSINVILISVLFNSVLGDALYNGNALFASLGLTWTQLNIPI